MKKIIVEGTNIVVKTDGDVPVEALREYNYSGISDWASVKVANVVKIIHNNNPESVEIRVEENTPHFWPRGVGLGKNLDVRPCTEVYKMTKQEGGKVFEMNTKNLMEDENLEIHIGRIGCQYGYRSGLKYVDRYYLREKGKKDPVADPAPSMRIPYFFMLRNPRRWNPDMENVGNYDREIPYSRKMRNLCRRLEEATVDLYKSYVSEEKIASLSEREMDDHYIKISDCHMEINHNDELVVVGGKMDGKTYKI